MFQSANKRLFFSLSQQLWSFSFRSQKIYLLGVSICNRLSADSDYLWRSGASIPVPLACKGSALPFELHPHSLELSRKLLFQSANKRLLISLSQQLWSFSFRSQKIYLLGVSICNRLSADSDYLYHYLQKFCTFITICRFSVKFFFGASIYLLGVSICNRLSADSDYLLEIRGINPRTSRMQSERSTI